MKIMIVCSGDWLERWSSFIRAIAKLEGNQLTIATACPTDKSKERMKILKAEFPECNIRIYRGIPGRIFGHDGFTVYSPFIIGLMREKPDIIHMIAEPCYMSTFQFLLIRNLFSTQTKVTIRAAQNTYKKFPFPFSYFEKFTYKYIDYICPIFQTQLDILRRKGYKGEIAFIGNGYDHELFKPMNVTQFRKDLNLNRFVIGFVGSIENYKGIYTLLEAVYQLKDKDFSVLMIGKGEEKESFKHMIKEKGLADHFVLIDEMSQLELPEYINCMDVLILPSAPAKFESRLKRFWPWIKPKVIVEQFGRILVEAMGCGVPVIGSNNGGIPEVIDQAGLIFEYNQPGALCERIELYMNNEETRLNYAKEGMKRVQQNFTWDRIAAEYNKIWTQWC